MDLQLIFVLALCTIQAGHAKDYSGHKLIRTVPNDIYQLSLLKELHRNYSDYDEISFWKEPVDVSAQLDILVHPRYSHSFLQQLSTYGLHPDVVFDDLQRLANEEKRSSGTTETDSFASSRYHTYDEINDWMIQQAAKCPEICEVFKIGYSYEGLPMNVFKISGNRNAPAIWIDAGIHAREWIAPATALYVLEKLLQGIEGKDDSARHLVASYTWYILPLANPDGYKYTWSSDRLWRKTRSIHPFSNCIGADANRNWNFHWGGPGTSGNPCSENYHGRYPFSEPETRAMANFLWRIRHELDIYLSLHAYGQFWLTPWGFTFRLPGDYTEMISMGNIATEALRKVNGTHYNVGTSSRMLYLASGGSDDWMKGVARVKYAYTVELADTGTHGFMLPPQYIASTAHEIYRAVDSMSVGVLRQKRRRLRRRRRKSVRSNTEAKKMRT